MSNKFSRFVEFSKPFIDGIKETFKVMMDIDVQAHSPKIKTGNKASGDISGIIGMNGKLESDEGNKDFKGQMVLSWNEDVYVNMANKMLMEEYTEYNEEIQDAGAEVCNIVMGNAKKILNPMGYKIEMATPSTVKGKSHEIIYPPETTIVEIIISTEIGDFSMELCYLELAE